MKQILQNLSRGELMLADVPSPNVRPGHLLIRTRKSLISAGTERMLLEFGRSNWIDRARQQPDKVKMVLDKIKTDGLQQTMDSVRSKLDEPIALGYCNVGEVIAVGDGVDDFAVGDRVASNGSHAEIVCVPKNLCAKIPSGVDDEAAAFTVVGAIALQGIRLLQPTLGERVVVTGLGLLGLLTAQLLRAHGCQVLGIDLDPRKLALAREFGVTTVDVAGGQDPIAEAERFSEGQGVDGVLITASTKSNEPISQAAKMCRKRGRVVLVGVIGLELSRSDFYQKEISFQVSCSYGPGRYDPAYEEAGHDYPFGLVRWTEQRNFQAFLESLREGRVDVTSLISHRFDIEEAAKAYALLETKEPYDGILLSYLAEHEAVGKETPSPVVHLTTPPLSEPKASTPVIAVLGAGNYARRTLLPAIAETKAVRQVIVSQGGVTAQHSGRKFGFEMASTDSGSTLTSKSVNTVFIVTRHDTHADLVCQALRADKNVFVEKPLALTGDELDQIEATYRSEITRGHPRCLMVGFNRRFAPHIVKAKELLTPMETPKTMIVTVNAGAIPKAHWSQDRIKGGGRLIGEGCHFIDLMRHLAGSAIVGVSAHAISGTSTDAELHDNVTVTLSFADGSIGTLHYFANGAKSFPKERVEVFCGGRILQLDNFRRLTGHGWNGFKKLSLWRQDKGQNACVRAFIDSIATGGAAPIPFDELLEVSRAAIDADRQLRGEKLAPQQLIPDVSADQNRQAG